MPLLGKLERIVDDPLQRCRAAGAWKKNRLVAGAGGVKVEAPMKMLSAKTKIVRLPFVK
jgi:hypothetical protein